MVRDVDTLEFIPCTVPFPEIKITDHLKQAAADIVYLLEKPPSNMIPSLQEGTPTNTALVTLAKLLNRLELMPTPPEETDIKGDKVSQTRVKTLDTIKKTNNTTRESPFIHTNRWNKTVAP